jgi:hypothetical protein
MNKRRPPAMAPAMDAFTSVYCPARSAASAPIASPVSAATDSVAWLSSAASGTMARTDSTKRRVCASGASFSR